MNLAVGGNSIEQPLYSGGYKIGNFLNKHEQTIKMIARGIFIILTIWFIVVLMQNTIADMELMETEATMLGATTAYMSMVYHQGCKSHGACSRSCPFISDDDPRIIITNQIDSAEELYQQTQQCVSSDTLMIANAIDKIADSTKAGTASSTWNGILLNEVNANQAIGVILNQLKTLDATFGSTLTINIAIIDAKNKAAALGAASVIQKNILVVASLYLQSQIMMQYIVDVSADKQQKILDYDQLVATAAMSANTGSNSISSIYAINNINNPSYTAAYHAMAPAANTTSQDIIAAMATLMSEARRGTDIIKTIIAKLANVSQAYHACRNVIDRFSNDLPGTMSNSKMTALIEANDYESAIIQTALEPDIVANHKKFAKERSSFESGGGIQSVRDDDNDVVPWVGLFGRPTYRKSNGASIDISTGTSAEVDVLKSIPSDEPTQLMRNSTLRLSTVRY
jgi:hypothetical protein